MTVAVTVAVTVTVTVVAIVVVTEIVREREVVIGILISTEMTIAIVL